MDAVAQAQEAVKAAESKWMQSPEGGTFSDYLEACKHYNTILETSK